MQKQVTNKKLMELVLKLYTVKELTKQSDLTDSGRNIVQSSLELGIAQTKVKRRKIRQPTRRSKVTPELQLSLL